MKYIITYLFWVVVFTFPIYAQLKSDRPGLSDPPIVVDKNAIHFEDGLSWTSSDYKKGYNDFDFTSALLRFGLFAFAELRATFDYSATDHGADDYYGVSGVSLGTKISFFDRDGVIPEFGVIAHLVLPWGSRRYQSNDFEPNVRFVFENSLSDDYIVNYNIGAIKDEGNWGYSYSFSVEGEVFKDVSMTLGYYSDVMQGVKPLVLGEYALVYFISDSFGVDVSGAISLSDSHDLLNLSVGFSTRIK